MIHVMNNVPKIVYGFGAIARAGEEIILMGDRIRRTGWNDIRGIDYFFNAPNLSASRSKAR